MKNTNHLMDTALEKVIGGTGTGGRYDRAIEKLDKVLNLIAQYKAEPGADESLAYLLSSYCQRIRTDLTDNYREDAELQLKTVIHVLCSHTGESKNLQDAYTILTGLFPKT